MIRRLRTRNCRSLVDLQSPEFARINVGRGPNGAGKSSLKDAISLLFSGTASGFETGMNLDALRTIGGPSKKWAIEAFATFNGEKHTITRNEGEGPRSQRQDLTEAITGVSGAKARACIESGELIRLDPKARQRLLLDLAPKAVVSPPPVIRKAVSDLLGEDHEEIDLPTLERLYKAAYEARADAARMVKAAGELEAPALPDVLQEMADDLPEIEEIKGALGKLRRDRDAALVKAAPSTVDLSPYQWAVDKTTREIERIQREIGQLPSNMELTRRAKEIVAKMHEASATNVEIEESRAKLTDALGAADGAMRAAKGALDAVKAQRGETGCCPVCDSKLTKTNRGKLEVSLTNKYEAAARERQRINEQLSHTTDPLSTVKLQREADDLSAKEVRLAGLLEDEKRHAAQLREDQEALANAEGDPGKPGDEAAATEAEQLAGRIAKGEGILEALVAYTTARKAYETGLASKAVEMKRHLALDQLVNDLGPGGIRKSCGNAGMLQFHDDLINELLAPLGFKVDLRPALDLEGDPLVTVEGRQTQLGMLSDGEKLAFGAAFACAVATYTKLGIVVVDRFEALDPGAHDAVMGILEGSGHQVFVLSVERDEGMEAVAAGVNAEAGATRMFLLREGTLTAPGIGKEAAA